MEASWLRSFQYGPAQATEHAALLLRGSVENLEIGLAQEPLPARNKRLRNYFKKRTRGDLEEAGKIRLRETRTAFRNVRGDGNCRPTHLAGKSKPFVVRKRASNPINQVREINGFLPGVQTFETKHTVSFLCSGSSPSSLPAINYQPSGYQ